MEKKNLCKKFMSSKKTDCDKNHATKPQNNKILINN